MSNNSFELQKTGTAIETVESNRAIQEVQASMIIAKRFPRDPNASVDRILQACTRTTLAEQALYAFPRGGQLVTGASIRLAEAMAQNWGNIQFGIREIEQHGNSSIVQAFAWDLETNTRQVREFHVKHERKARGTISHIEDPRDIYELVANQGARRMRACILSVIPGDVQDAAIAQCELTQKSISGPSEDQIKALVAAFKQIGVERKQIEKRIGHSIESIVSAEIVQLRKIFGSIKDGMSSPQDWFKSDHVEPAASSPPWVAQKEKPKVAKWPQTIDGYLVDAREVIYDDRIHSSGKVCTQQGDWRRKRGVTDEQIKEMEITLSQVRAEKEQDKKPETHSEPDQEEVSDSADATPTDMFSEQWFSEKISKAKSEQDLEEYEDLLREVQLPEEVRVGLGHKIDAMRADMQHKDSDNHAGAQDEAQD